MTNTDRHLETRRRFISNAGLLASTAAIAGCAPAAIATSSSPARESPQRANPDWDLSWIDTLHRATDKAVFDWPSLGDPGDPIVVEIAERYLDNCRSVYRPGTYDARAVLNIRTQAIGAAMTDQLWERYALGTKYSTKDPTTQQPAVRNPFWHRAPDPAPGITVPTLPDRLARGAIILVCDFAMGHLAKRLASKAGRSESTVHADLRSGLVQGAYVVPSGIFGLARAQNAGCAYVRM